MISGSRTIRTEEAVLISLAALEEKFAPLHRPKDFDLSHSIPQSEDTGVRQFAENPFGSNKRKNRKNKHLNDVQLAELDSTVETEPGQTENNDNILSDDGDANETENIQQVSQVDLSKFD